MSGIVRANNTSQSGIVTNVETIDSDDYVDASIDNAHLADDAVDSDELVAGAVDTAHIGNNQVTGAKLNPSLVLGDIIYADGTDTIARLAKGSENEVLTMGGSNAPTWAAGGGMSSKFVQGTRAASAGAGTQEIDTAGFAPVAAIILAIEGGTQAVAIGFVDSADNRGGLYGQTQASYPNTWNEHSTGFQVRDGSDYSNGVMTLTDDGVDIAWVLYGSGVDVTWKILFFG